MSARRIVGGGAGGLELATRLGDRVAMATLARLFSRSGEPKVKLR